MVDINQSRATTTYNLQHMMQPTVNILGFHANKIMWAEYKYIFCRKYFKIQAP
jgi:hypothetical protein